MPSDSKRDVSPEKNPTAKKTRGESFDKAMNKPNDPKVDQDIFDGCYNPNDVYDDGDSEKDHF